MTVASERLLRCLMGILVVSMIAVAGGRVAGGPVPWDPEPSRNADADRRADGPQPDAGMSMQVPQAMRDAMSQGKTPPPLKDVLPSQAPDAVPGTAKDGPAVQDAPAATRGTEAAAGPREADGGACPVAPPAMPPAAGTFSEKELEDMLAMPDIPPAMRTMIEGKLRAIRQGGN